MLFFSLGGGYLGIKLVDVSSNSVLPKEAYGERLGGDDFTEAVLSDIRESVLRKHVGAKIKEFVLHAEAIRVKHSLTSARGADVDIQIKEVEPDVDFMGTCTQVKFRKAAKDLFTRIEECLSKVNGRVRSIVPVGGGS